MTDEHSHPCAHHLLGLRVTEQEHESFKREAHNSGFDITTLLRLRLFGTLKGVRIIRRPSIEVMLLLDVINKLNSIGSDIDKTASHIRQIAQRFNQGSREPTALAQCQHIIERYDGKLSKTLQLVEQTMTQKHQILHRGDIEKLEDSINQDK